MTASRKSGRIPEQNFLATYDTTAFDRPSLAVDVVILTVLEGNVQAALVRRMEHPDSGRWSLPGGFVKIDESLDQAAARILMQKAGLANVYLEQLYTFGEVKRDPRTRVVSVGYYALVDQTRLKRSDADLVFERIFVPWQDEEGGPVEVRDQRGDRLSLAFDHAEILGMAIKRIRGKLDYTPIGFQLLPNAFTLRRLQDVHETIIGRKLNKDSFRRKMLASQQLKATGEREIEVGHRPAELYQFTKRSAV